MLREQRRRGAGAARPTRRRRMTRIFGVWTFFALLHIWGVGRQSPTFAERIRFFLSLFAL